MAEPIRDAASATTYGGFSAVRTADRHCQPTDGGRRRSLALPLALTTAAIAAGLAWFLTAPEKSAIRTAPTPAVAPTSIRNEPASARPPPQPAAAAPAAPRVITIEKAPVRLTPPVRRAAAHPQTH